MSAVDVLSEDFRAVTTTGLPRLVVLRGTSGRGKTRIVQEFYSRLAASQTLPRYWPPALSPDASEDARDSLAGRRRILPPDEFAVPRDARIEWMWLGVRGEPQLALGGALGAIDVQVRTHLRHLVARAQALEASSEALKKVLGLVMTALHVPDFLELANALMELGPTVREAVRESKAALDGPGLHASADLSGRERAHELAPALASLLRATPTTLVLDDAHWLDPSGVTLCSSLMGLRVPALLIATAWPEELTAQAAVPGSFGSWVRDLAVYRPDALRILDVGPLQQDALEQLLLSEWPATDPAVASAIAVRADGNPLVLYLLLTLPAITERLSATSIDLSAEEVQALPGVLEELVQRLWDGLEVGVKRILVAAAIQGEVADVDVLARTLDAGDVADYLTIAGEAYWLRTLAAPELREFTERVRYEIAARQESSLFLPPEQGLLRIRALEAILTAHRRADPARELLLDTLHVRLARENVEENLGRVAPVALRLGVLLVQDLRFREARAYLQDAARWGQFAGEIEVYVEARIELARLLRYETRWSDAADVLVDTIALATASLGPSHRLTALANLRLGIVRRYQAKGPEAESARQAALIWLESQGSEDPSLAFRVRVLEGQLRIAAQDWAGAVAVLLPLATSADAEFGKTSSEAMDGWELAGFAYDRVDRQRAIEIRRDLVSRAVERYNLTDHPGVASFYADLAYSLAGIGSYSEAEELALRAVALRARQFGRDHPRTLNSRGVLAHVWIADAWNIRETRDFASAEPYFEKALHEANAILRVRELHGGGAMNARVRVAYCLDGLDRFVEADVLYDQLLAYHVTKRARALDSARVKPIASRYVAMLQRANMDARLAAVRSTFAGL